MSGFFTAINTYAQQADLNVLIKSVAGGKLSVILVTKNKAGITDPALNGTQRFVGTPDELDQQFITALESLGEGYKSLEDTIAAVKKIQDNAKQAVVAKAGEKTAKPAPAASAPAPVAASSENAVEPSPGADEAEEENLFGGV